MRLMVFVASLSIAFIARADYWMTFCKVKPDADGFVTIKAGSLTVVVYKTQVWYQKMPGEAPDCKWAEK